MAIMTPTETPTPIPAFAPVERPLLDVESPLLDVSFPVAVSVPVLGVFEAKVEAGVEMGVVKSFDCQRMEIPFAFTPITPIWLVGVPPRVYV